MNDITNIEGKILVIRGLQVMLDRDLAELYGVETKVLNQAVKRNIKRFPDRFMFKLNKVEAESCSKSQFVTLNEKGNFRGQNIKKLPYAFTEHGVAMLASILRSSNAIKIGIQIIDAFVAMRRYILANSQVFQRLDRIETKQLEAEQKIETIFTIMDTKLKINRVSLSKGRYSTHTPNSRN